jgi:hypothetical protein
MAAIRYSVKKFRQEFEEDPGLATNSLSKKMTQQIDQHGEKLFTDPITVVPLPQQTDNNRPSAHQQYPWTVFPRYQARGTTPYIGHSRQFWPDKPIIKNRGNPDYMNILLDVKANLEELLAE